MLFCPAAGCLCLQAQVEALVSMCTADNVDQLLQGNPDYVLDAIDNIDTKVRYCSAVEPWRQLESTAS